MLDRGALVDHPPLDPEGNQLADDDTRLARWREAINQFSETGLWIEHERHCCCCRAELPPTQPGLRCPECVRADSEPPERRDH